MTSYILHNRYCQHCDLSQVMDIWRRVLRTPTEEICTNCGAVLNTFPAMDVTFPGENPPISIPEEVSILLAELLKRRIFSVARGNNPRVADRSFSGNVPAHRAGDQALIELTGTGNCTATLRWNFSEEELYRQSRFEIERQPKPSLDSVDAVMPTRIRRALEVVFPALAFSGSMSNDRSLWYRALRFERTFPLKKQPLDLARLILVVKLELSWLHVGESFPGEIGPRRFYVGQSWDPPHLTADEALDVALASTIGSSRYMDAGIWDALHRGWKVGGYDRDPLRNFDHRPNPYLHNPRTWLKAPQWTAGYYGVVSSGERGLLPAGVATTLSYRLDKPAGITVSIDEEELLCQHFEAGEGSVEMKASFGHKTGTVVIHVKFSDDDEKTIEYHFVTQDEYITAMRRIVEQFKRQELAQLLLHAGVVESRMARPGDRVLISDGGRPVEGRHSAGIRCVPDDGLSAFQAGEKVAVLIGAQWFEAVYRSGQHGTIHSVDVTTLGGTSSWSVMVVKPLVQALREGLTVIAPFDAQVQSPHARLEGFSLSGS